MVKKENLDEKTGSFGIERRLAFDNRNGAACSLKKTGGGEGKGKEKEG